MQCILCVVNQVMIAQASIAQAPGSAYTTWLSIFSVLGLVPVVALRAVKGDQVPGTIFNFIYGVSAITAITYPDVRTVWKEVRPVTKALV